MKDFTFTSKEAIDSLHRRFHTGSVTISLHDIGHLLQDGKTFRFGLRTISINDNFSTSERIADSIDSVRSRILNDPDYVCAYEDKDVWLPHTTGDSFVGLVLNEVYMPEVLRGESDGPVILADDSVPFPNSYMLDVYSCVLGDFAAFLRLHKLERTLPELEELCEAMLNDHNVNAIDAL